MPNLSELTDYNPQDQVTPQGRLYVSPSIPTNDDGDYFTKPVASMPELPADNVVERIIKKLAETEFSGGTNIGNKLAGTGGQERYQLWPEKIVRSALTAIPDAYSGKIPMNDVDPETGELVPSQAMIGRAMDMASFAGAGGVGGTGEGGAVLGAGPSLRPALKYKDRLYKGKEGQEHQDVIPPHLYPEFQKMAMSGEDISHYNFGFVNDKGHFLSREDALKYGIDSGLIDPQAGKFGALTSTLMADSSKPGTAIEAMAKTYPLAKPADRWTNTLGQNDHLIQNMSPDEFLNQSRPLKIDAESRETIDALKQHMEEGKQLDPLELHANGKEDGRHRAIAAKELGIGQVPVINYRPPAQPFYSALEHNVNAISQNKMNGEAWLGTLANKPGVKPEELDWTGLRSFLEENKGKPVTKEQVQEHLQNNKVELEEVSKGNKPNLREETDDLYNSLSDSQTYPQNNATKYHDYQLPGGENYREMLMTLPNADAAKSARMTQIESLLQSRPAGKEAERATLREEYKKLADETRDSPTYKSSHWDEPNILAHVRMNDRTIPVEFTAAEQAALQARQIGQTKLADLRKEQGEIGKDIAFQARSLEYDRQSKIRADMESGKISKVTARKQMENYVEHPELKPLQDKLQALRAKEDAVLKSLPAEPKQKQLKSLHLEEIQSDWHQQGRDKGYKNAGLTEAERDNFNALNALPDKVRTPEQTKLLEDLYAKSRAASSGVPDAPFKKTWHELALKRMLREAAEKGYDRLSWTPGEAQAARYDLSKSVDSLLLDPKKDGTFKLIGRKNGSNAIEQDVTADKLPDIVGKEAAKNLLSADKNKYGMHELSGQQLKIGGEGMKGFYDQIIPKALEKIGKEHGVKVKSHMLETNPKGWHITPPSETVSGKWMVKSNDYNSKGYHFDTKAEAEANLAQNIAGERAAQPVHYIDIPQSLKDRAMNKGFPLFSGGYVYTPVDGDPFKDKK